MEYTKAAWERMADLAVEHRWILSDDLNDIVTVVEDDATVQGITKIGLSDLRKLIAPFMGYYSPTEPKSYICHVHNPSGGIIQKWEGGYFDGMMFAAAQASYYNRECPVYVYQNGIKEHVDNETVWSFFNGVNISVRNARINAMKVGN